MMLCWIYNFSKGRNNDDIQASRNIISIKSESERNVKEHESAPAHAQVMRQVEYQGQVKSTAKHAEEKTNINHFNKNCRKAYL